MIARVRGELLERDADWIVVDTGGVGYQLFVTVNTLAVLGDPGERVDLHVHTQVREDAITLFGFATKDERDLFRRLIGISGIGPRLGLALLSAMSPGDLARAILMEDTKALIRVPGVGKRTAERIIVELKDRIGELPVESEAAPRSPSPRGAAARGGILEDLQAALVSLGYKPAGIRRVVKELESRAEAGVGLDELIRQALNLLQRRSR